jgi:dimethylargininase
MFVENHIFIGQSERTNAEGARQLGAAVTRQGFSWSAIPVLIGLHLKTGVNYIGQNTLLMLEAYADRPEFDIYHKILIEPDEEPAANTLLINDTLIMPKGFPKTKNKLKTLGLPVIELNMSEVKKMDGGLSCLSLRF